MNPSLPVSGHGRGILIAATGVLVLSFDALLVRLAGASAATIAVWRGGLMFVALGAFLAIRDGGRPWRGLAAGGWMAVVVAIVSGVDSLVFVLSVMHTYVANTVVILATAPLFAAAFSGIFLRERVPLRTWVAVGVAAAGVSGVFAGAIEAGHLLGDLFGLAAAILMAANLTLLRAHPGIQRIPVVWLGGLVTCLCALLIPGVAPFSLDATGYAAVGVMGALQMPLALILITVATRMLPAAEVSLFLLVETVLAPIWVWWVLAEAPPSRTFLAGGLILATLSIHSWLQLRREPGPVEGRQ